LELQVAGTALMC